jgi:hypothetical protein
MISVSLAAATLNRRDVVAVDAELVAPRKKDSEQSPNHRQQQQQQSSPVPLRAVNLTNDSWRALIGAEPAVQLVELLFGGDANDEKLAETQKTNTNDMNDLFFAQMVRLVVEISDNLFLTSLTVEERVKNFCRPLVRPNEE